MFEEFIEKDGFMMLANSTIGGYGLLMFLNYDYLMALNDLNTLLQSFVIGYIVFLGIHTGLSLPATNSGNQNFSSADIILLSGVCLGAVRILWVIF